MNFEKINSITKYPSILTYHQIQEKEKNGLKDVIIETSKFEDNDEINFYEKIDGENSRIVFIGNGKEVDYFIGSRKELLYAKGDRFCIPTGNIAWFLKPTAEKISKEIKGLNGLLVIYFETYGGATPKRKNYTEKGTQDVRVFDIFKLSKEKLEEIMQYDVNKIASWRDNLNQPFVDCKERKELCKLWELEHSPLLNTMTGKEFPKTIEDVYDLLLNYKDTKVGIDVQGKSEGIVVRTKDRKKISKIRFEDYERTFRYLENLKK